MKTQLTEFAINSLKGKLGNCPKCGKDTHSKTKRGTWCYFYDKFTRFYTTGKSEYSIFVKGNQKLPFWAFSDLPAITCPGAGECLKWCYSFKAWRYPAAYFRQLQKKIMKTIKDIITNLSLLPIRACSQIT